MNEYFSSIDASKVVVAKHIGYWINLQAKRPIFATQRVQYIFY